MKRGSSRNPFAFTKKEIQYLERGREHLDLVYPAHPDSVQEGFEYLFAVRSDLKPFDGDNPERMNPMRRMGVPIQAMVSMMKTMHELTAMLC